MAPAAAVAHAPAAKAARLVSDTGSATIQAASPPKPTTPAANVVQ
jgi:hypothetical protein